MSRKIAHLAIPETDYQFVDEKRVDKLICDLKSVTKSRFSAARRLEKADSLSQWTVNLISLQLILIPTLTMSGAIKADAYLNSYSVFAAVFILFFSTSQNAEKFSLKAHRMHDCGIRLNKLRRNICALNTSSVSTQQFNNYIEAYDDILRDYDNHDQVDYLSSEYEINFKKIGLKRYFTIDYLRLIIARSVSFSKYYLTLAFFLFIPPVLYFTR